jgi:serine/threonine protein kinase
MAYKEYNRYLQYLKEVYPQGKDFDNLLPKPNNNRIDLSQYGLTCLGKIGEGALSSVYIVQDRKDGRVYACKVTPLNNPSVSTHVVAAHTLKEIQILESIAQNNIHGMVCLYSYSPSKETIEEYANPSIFRKLSAKFLPSDDLIVEIMQLAVPYQSFMESFFHSGRRLTVNQACAILLDFILPLEELHNKLDVVHRDIKVGNTMLARCHDGTVRGAIADFNISKEFVGSFDTEYTNIGTFGYNPRIVQDAPSRVAISRETAKKTDTYGIAQIVYQLLNRGEMAPAPKGGGTILPPKDSPSREFSDLLISMLNPNTAHIPDCQAIVKRAINLIGPTTPTKNTPMYHKAPSGNYHRNSNNGGYQTPKYFPNGSNNNNSNNRNRNNNAYRGNPNPNGGYRQNPRQNKPHKNTNDQFPKFHG